jgi:hypothetical protein
VAEVRPYQPGQFYLRELPTLHTVLLLYSLDPAHEPNAGLWPAGPGVFWVGLAGWR